MSNEYSRFQKFFSYNKWNKLEMLKFPLKILISILMILGYYYIPLLIYNNQEIFLGIGKVLLATIIPAFFGLIFLPLFTFFCIGFITQTVIGLFVLPFTLKRSIREFFEKNLLFDFDYTFVQTEFSQATMVFGIIVSVCIGIIIAIIWGINPDFFSSFCNLR